MQTAYEDDALSVRFRLRDAQTTVVTFASLRHDPTPVPRHEFHNELMSLRDVTGAHHAVNIITVADLSRRYYLNGATGRIVAEVNDILHAAWSRRTVALGASMGGFAAVALATKLTACDLVVAFGPHSAVNPSVAPFDQRSMGLRSQIVTWDIDDAVEEMDGRIRYHLLYGDDDPVDMEHAARFRARNLPGVKLEFVAGRNHGTLMSYWQEHDSLGDFLSGVILDEPGEAHSDRLDD